jgi:hypothetical protein
MRVSSVLLGILLCLLGGCGGGSGSPGPAVAVTIAPNPVSLAPASTQTFTATVANATNAAVTWSVQEGASGGTISSAGLYTAPAAAGTFHVVATSQADTTKTSTATVTVNITIAVTPTSATITLGQSQSFVATVAGTTNTAVTWSVQEGTAGGSITSAGVYTPPATPGTYHVVAVSQADAGKQSVVTVIVQAGSASGTIN